MEKVTRWGWDGGGATDRRHKTHTPSDTTRPTIGSLRKEIPGLQTAHKRRRRTTEQTRHHLTDRPWNTSVYSKNTNENSSVFQQHEESTKRREET